MPITATIVSSCVALRRRLSDLLNRAGSFHCVGSYASFDDLFERFTFIPSDIALIEVSPSGGDWIDEIRRAKTVSPRVPLALLVPHEDPEAIIRGLAAGASGYILRDAPDSSFLSFLEELRRGASPISGTVAGRLIEILQRQTLPREDLRHLSGRERDILDCLAQGHSYKEMAARLSISINTVRTYVRRLYAKLEVPCRAHAVLKTQPGLPEGLRVAPTLPPSFA